MKAISVVQWLIVPVLLLVGGGAGFILGRRLERQATEAQIGSVRGYVAQLREDAQRDAEARKREILLAAKEEALRSRNDLEREIRDRRAELQRMEKRLLQKEESLDRKLESLERREEALGRREAELQRLQQEAQDVLQARRQELEKISGLTAEQGKQMLLDELRHELEHESAILVKESEAAAKAEAEKKAREIISLAIQRCAADHTAETTVSVVALPNDEMKGRIIGREGRNIRTLETLTGVDLIIDDTPEAVILSGFDPVRREVARLALERLVTDGRIHPARIEEMVAKAQKEVDTAIREAGEQALLETGVTGIHPELVRLLGRMKYRTSYGQNVLKHSLEVAHLAAVMAAELGADTALAKRAGLLHDIGKAVDHEIEGQHALIGADLARRYRENPAVVHCIAAHHGDEDPNSVEAVLVAAADAISASRPGARRETLEAYVKRLEKLEAIADSFEGVEKSFAIQAGREIRIMVKPERVDDTMAPKMARDIVKRIESELEYPGQIKVTVIRETRAVDYAK